MAKKTTSSEKRPAARTKKAAAPKSGKRTARATAEAESVPVIASLTDEKALGEIHQVAEKLAAEGMTVKQVLPMSGVITGSCLRDNIADLNRKVPQVVVEPEIQARMA